MTTDSTDPRIVGVDVERTARADHGQSLFDVHFVLSEEAPAGWPMVATAYFARHAVAGRRTWARGDAVVVRCAVDEIEAVLAALRPALVVANREYRAVHADRERAAAADEVFERGERRKLRRLIGRLVFDSG